MDKVIYKKEVYDEETGSIKDVVLLSGPPPNGGNGNGNTGEPNEWFPFIPGWRVGASGGFYALPGEGYIQGWYKKRPAILRLADGGISNIEEVELFVELKAVNPSIPAGEGFEIEVPDELRPSSPGFARGGGGDLWIMGGSNSFAISPKWTDRNQRPMRIIILLDGREWTTNVPKAITEKASLYFWMKYFK